MTRTGPRTLYFSMRGPSVNETDQRDRSAERRQETGKQPRRGARTEGKAALPGQLGGGDQGQNAQP